MSKVQEQEANPKPRSLTIVSMNLAGCVPSAEAPPSWNQTVVSAYVRQELLSKNPDILALQECPAKPEEWAKELFEGYRVMGIGSAHAGYVVLLVRNDLAARATALSIPTRLPAVMARIVLDDDKVLNVVSCHLAPFRGGAGRRSRQIQALLEASGSNPLLIAGDTNTRKEEDEVMEGLYQLRDVWKEAGQDPATEHTWDTENHVSEGGFFNRYHYGENTREYRTRYDRFYVSEPKKKSKAKSLQISVESFGLLANRPVNPFTKTHFLSDHFGITCELELKQIAEGLLE